MTEIIFVVEEASEGGYLARALGPSIITEADTRVTRQTGSHIRLTTEQEGEHHVTIPDHSPLRVGTLAAILAEVAAHFGLSREELRDQLFG